MTDHVPVLNCEISQLLQQKLPPEGLLDRLDDKQKKPIAQLAAWIANDNRVRRYVCRIYAAGTNDRTAADVLAARWDDAVITDTHIVFNNGRFRSCGIVIGYPEAGFIEQLGGDCQGLSLMIDWPSPNGVGDGTISPDRHGTWHLPPIDAAVGMKANIDLMLQ